MEVGLLLPRQDIKMDSIAKMARSHQPDLLIVDRTIHGKYENYLTLEAGYSDKQLPFPWESCITLSSDWGWVPNAKFKSANDVIALLVEVTAKEEVYCWAWAQHQLVLLSQK